MRIPLRPYWALFSHYLRPQRGRVVLLAMLILSGIGLQLVNPQVLRYFIDAARHGADQRTLLIAGVLLMLYRVDWRIGGGLTLFALAVLFTLNRLRGISIPAWIDGRQSSAEMAGFLEERLAGTEDIRSSRATEYVMTGFYRIMRDIFRNYRRAHLLATVSSTVSRFSLAVGIALGLGISSALYLHHQITLGSVFLTSYYAGILAWPLNAITNQVDDLQQATAGLARVNALRATPITVKDGPGAALPRGAQGWATSG